MALTLTKDTVREILERSLSGHDHRGVIIDRIDELFINSVLEFFREVVDAKMRSQSISLDWYRQAFLNPKLDTKEIMLMAGLNSKTVTNKRGSARKEIVIEEALYHHSKFLELVESLTASDINIKLALMFKGVSVDLDLNESLVVINALAVRRAAIRGGAWSSAGKQVEVPLMETLCRLFGVDDTYYPSLNQKDYSTRETDFYLTSPTFEKRVRCEVKLMGKGNPESADAIHARGTRVFVGSTLSDTNKRQFDDAGVYWTELQTPKGFLRFGSTLQALGITHKSLPQQDDYSREIKDAIRQTLNLPNWN